MHSVPARGAGRARPFHGGGSSRAAPHGRAPAHRARGHAAPGLRKRPLRRPRQHDHSGPRGTPQVGGLRSRGRWTFLGAPPCAGRTRRARRCGAGRTGRIGRTGEGCENTYRRRPTQPRRPRRPRHDQQRGAGRDRRHRSGPPFPPPCCIGQIAERRRGRRSLLVISYMYYSRHLRWHGNGQCYRKRRCCGRYRC